MSLVAPNTPAAPGPYRFSVEEYNKLGEIGFFGPEDRVELLDGEIIVMSPIGLRHVQAMSWITECFSDQRRGRYMTSPGNPVWLNDHSEPQPDVMLVPRVRKLEHHPRPEEVFLLVEVSDTSLAHDRKLKLRAYAKAGVREYWIVNLEEDAIEVYQQPKGERYTVTRRFAPGETLSPLAFDDVVVPVADIIPPR